MKSSVFFLGICLDLVIITAGCSIDEQNALLVFYNSTGGNSWTSSVGWGNMTLGCCNWFGITCLNDRVIGLDFPDNKIQGVLTDSFFVNFDQLQRISLDNNRLIGTLPKSFMNLTSLNVVSLRNNQLSGNPLDLFKLPNIKSIDLYGNAFVATLPSALPPLIANMTLRLNKFQGSIPSTWIAPYLQNLDLGFNALIGEIPSTLGKLRTLKWLDLSGNAFNGTLPSVLGQVVTAVPRLSTIGGGGECAADQKAVWFILGYAPPDGARNASAVGPDLRMSLHSRCTQGLPQFGPDYISEQYY